MFDERFHTMFDDESFYSPLYNYLSHNLDEVNKRRIESFQGVLTMQEATDDLTLEEIEQMGTMSIEELFENDDELEKMSGYVLSTQFRSLAQVCSLVLDRPDCPSQVYAGYNMAVFYNLENGLTNPNVYQQELANALEKQISIAQKSVQSFPDDKFVRLTSGLMQLTALKYIDHKKEFPLFYNTASWAYDNLEYIQEHHSDISEWWKITPYLEALDEVIEQLDLIIQT